MYKKAFIISVIIFFYGRIAYAQDYGDPLIRYAGNYTQLTVAEVSERTLEITLSPLSSVTSNIPASIPEKFQLAEYPRKIIFESRSVMDPFHITKGEFSVDILRAPSRIIFKKDGGEIIQQISWTANDDGIIEFLADDQIEKLVLENKDDTTEIPIFVNANSEWAIYFHYPMAGDWEFRFENRKGTFTPEPDQKNGPIQFFFILGDEKDQLIEEIENLAGLEFSRNV